MRSEFSSVPSGWNVVLSVGGGSLEHGSCLHPWGPSRREGGQDSGSVLSDRDGGSSDREVEP